jgi:hypothetical protein
MRQTALSLLALGLFPLMLTGCHGFGAISARYVNDSDPQQTLELTTRQTVKGLFGGGLAAPTGSFVLSAGEKLTSGNYKRDRNTYVLSLEGNREWKVNIQPDSTLRDENGMTWRLQSQSRQLRSL